MILIDIPFPFFSVVVFLYDSLVDSLKFDWKKTIYYFTPPFTCIMCFFGYSTMSCYAEQRGLVLLMINYAMADVTLNLMLHNMAGRSFSIFQFSIFMLLGPIIAFYTVGLSVEMERMIPKVICPLAWCVFMCKRLSWSVPLSN